MRKIMMAALFSVLSLSACAVDDVATDESDGAQIQEAIEPEAPAVRPEEDLADEAIELTPELSTIACNVNDECPSNVCDLEKRKCRLYPF
jgi:hypothetical protein